MRSETFILIPGRSTEQGTSVGDKASAQYRQVTRTLRVNPGDLARLGLRAGDLVRLRAGAAEIEVACASAGDELPSGMLFIAYGPESSRLLDGETHGTGMPDSKGIEVELVVPDAREGGVGATPESSPAAPRLRTRSTE
jgi:formylmethanofuran dehydrogenase subunit D